MGFLLQTTRRVLSLTGRGARGPAGIDHQTPIAQRPGRFLQYGASANGRSVVGVVGATPANAVAATDLAGAGGASMVGVGARSVSDKLGEIVSVKDTRFAGGAKGDNVTDDTAAIQAALDYLIVSGTSGALYLPRGIYRVSALSIVYTLSVPLRIYGDGLRSSVLRKLGMTTDPVLSIAATGVLDIYGEFENFSVDGAGVARAAIAVINAARFKMRRIGMENASVGFEGVGTLTFELEKCLTNANAIGVRTRAGAVSSNLISIRNHEARGNTDRGLDLGGGEAIHIADCDITANGTAGNTGTGGIIFRADCGLETGTGGAMIVNSYLELNKGVGFAVENATALSVTVIGLGCYNMEAGRAITIGAIRSFTLIDVRAAGAADVVQINAANSLVVGGLIATLIDTSTHRTRIGAPTSTSAGAVRTNEVWVEGAAGHELLLTDGTTVGQSAEDSTIYKYGTGRLRISPGGTETIALDPGEIGFFGATPVARPTGVPVTPLGIHTALVQLGLITA